MATFVALNDVEGGPLIYVNLDRIDWFTGQADYTALWQRDYDSPLFIVEEPPTFVHEMAEETRRAD